MKVMQGGAAWLMGLASATLQRDMPSKVVFGAMTVFYLMY